MNIFIKNKKDKGGGAPIVSYKDTKSAYLLYKIHNYGVGNKL